MDEDIQSLLRDPLTADTPGFRVRPVITVAADSLMQTSGIDGLLAELGPELARDLRSAVLSLLFDDSLRISRGYLANPPGGVFDIPERRRTDLRGMARRLSGLSAHDAALIKGRKVAIVDDVISTGGSLSGLEKLVEEAGGEVFVKAFVLAEGEAAERPDVRYLQKIPIIKE